jgi:hypothetical protein
MRAVSKRSVVRGGGGQSESTDNLNEEMMDSLDNRTCIMAKSHLEVDKYKLEIKR